MRSCSGPSGVTIDPAAGKIYWTSQDGDQGQVGNLNGEGSVTDLVSDVENPLGVAIDAAAYRI